MNVLDYRAKIIATLAAIAPEVEEAEIDDDEDFRDQFDFDSMDFLNFAIALSKEFSLDIPEKDYPKLSSLDSALAYLKEK